ncbi:MAG: nucleotidyl transferase AbiEii/AbiGii toxin family protein [Rudaea sp.]|uniref:nucleotidyl transferase AbiEii/AbiGii toxin family protein n=1 Tax=Rudaea sp. TaxID=2136325 RepID=UPI0039E63D94
MSLGAVFDAALAAQAAAEALNLPHCIIGGVALQRWGEPRYTIDADLSVLVEHGQESRVASALLARLPARIGHAHEFAMRSRVVLAQSAGVGLDIVLAGLPFEARVIARATAWQLGAGASLRTCSAEDLIVMKAFAARDKDWADVTGILERQGAKLDLALIRSELEPLAAAKEAPEVLRELDKRLLRFGLGE